MLHYLLHVQLPWVLEIIYLCITNFIYVYIHNWNWSYILLLPPFLWYWMHAFQSFTFFTLEIRPLLPQGSGHRRAAVFVCRLAHLNHRGSVVKVPRSDALLLLLRLQKYMFFWSFLYMVNRSSETKTTWWWRFILGGDVMGGMKQLFQQILAHAFFVRFAWVNKTRVWGGPFPRRLPWFNCGIQI